MASALREENRVLMEKMLSEAKEELKAMTYSHTVTRHQMITKRSKITKSMASRLQYRVNLDSALFSFIYSTTVD